jgi:nicotinamide-nucleotide amidase
MEEQILELGEALKSREMKLATAESCTGGGLAYFLTSVSGSSDWFERGFVTYSNLAKEEQVGVRHSTLLNYGAVSPEVAREMAEGTLGFSQAQISVAITGIAGPNGGSAEKPVGMVCFAWAGINVETMVKTEFLKGDRKAIRDQSIAIALKELLRIVKN